MKKRKLFMTSLLLLGAGVMASCGEVTIPDISRSYEPIDSSSLYVKKVDNLSDDFIMGMDASSVISEEQSGVKFYNFNHEEKDVFEVLSENGINYIRVRIWNDPYDSNGKGYGGGNNDIDKAIEIGKRATKYNMKLLVNFHYSDFWADPSKQMVPKAWTGMDFETKKQALYDYTKDCMQKLRNAGVAVGMVQVGNETNGGKMAGETRFDYFVSMFNRGAAAVREVYPNALIACHFANPEKTNNYLDWAAKMKKYNADYDVFGSSYYPYWHGTLDNLSSVLSQIASTYDKKTMVLETSYAFTSEDSDGWSNTIGETTGFDTKDYPFTVAGQANCMREIIDTVANKTTNGIGVCYWEGTWITVGDTALGATKDTNSELWQKYGSGWASSYAKDYDPDDAGKWYGGCAVDNQAFFKPNGQPIESLKVWNLVRFGNEGVAKYIDSAEDVNVTLLTTDEIKLPSTVNVIYNDNSKAPEAVTWKKLTYDPNGTPREVDINSFDLADLKKAGNAKYTVTGEAGGFTVYCYLTIMELNYLENYGFENGTDIAPWVFTNNGHALDDDHKAGVTAENPQTGTYGFHFWSNTDGVNFDVEQTVSVPTAGTYKFQATFTGGDGNPDTDNFYVYAKINGEVVKTAKGQISEYQKYHDALISEITYREGDTLTVGFHCESSAAGVWGSVDDCLLNFVG